MTTKTAKKTPKTAAKRTAAAKPTKASAKVETKLHGVASGYTYPGMGKGGDHNVTRSCTIAILKASGFINVSPKTGLVTKPRTAGDYSLFAALTAGKLARAWGKLLKSGEYIAKAQAASKGEHSNGYNSQAEQVARFSALIAKGGKATIQGKNGPIEVSFVKLGS